MNAVGRAATFGAASGERIANAEVTVYITPAGGPSTTKALEPIDLAGLASFGAFVPVGAPGPSKVRFEVKRPGMAGPEGAEREHRIADPRRPRKDQCP